MWNGSLYMTAGVFYRKSNIKPGLIWGIGYVTDITSSLI